MLALQPCRSHDVIQETQCWRLIWFETFHIIMSVFYSTRLHYNSLPPRKEVPPVKFLAFEILNISYLTFKFQKYTLVQPEKTNL